MAGGPPLRRGGGSERARRRGGNVYEGCDQVVESVEREAGEEGSGLKKESFSDAIFFLRGEHIRGGPPGAAGIAGARRYSDEIKEREGDTEEYIELLDCCIRS